MEPVLKPTLIDLYCCAGGASMGINWMVRDELREAIPPAYTKFIGSALLAHIASVRLAA